MWVVSEFRARWMDLYLLLALCAVVSLLLPRPFAFARLSFICVDRLDRLRLVFLDDAPCSAPFSFLLR
jgi:hypothetical protein